MSGELQAPVGDAEWWVMRVVVEGGADLEAPAWAKLSRARTIEVLQLIRDGELVTVNNDVCQPIEVFKTQSEATGRAVREHQRSGVVHKVVLNVDL